ncbi:MAG TPA: hypothetical protein VFQ38_11690 [Longimicrobiales bacterium]|nr:hypothetical protein [Longimicrobiales bacterium]
MSARTLLRAAALLGAALLALARAAAGQQGTWRANVDVAVQRGAAGDFASASRLLRGALAACAASAEGRSCRRGVSYSLGYVYQLESRRDPAGQDSLLPRAAEFYRAALAVDSSDGATIYNLALVYRASPPDAAHEAFLQDAARRDPMRRAAYDDFLGDYYRDAGRWGDALEAYRRAAALSPEDAAPRVGLLQVYRRLPADRAAELLELAADWETRFPELAAQADALVAHLARSAEAGRPALAEQAAIRWAALLARERRLSGESLQALPADWAPTDDLRAYLQRPDTTLSEANWWRRSPERGEVLARLALALGSRRLSEGDPAAAERIWQYADGFVPRWDGLHVDLMRELALLYFRRPQLDLSGDKLRGVESRLFSMKGGAIESDDREAVQRFHTALGLIYTEKRQWRPGGGVDGALYQLGHALETADRRGFYQPLPELRDLLSQAYDSTGRPDLARALDTLAAAAYLDTDDLDAAAEVAARSAPGRRPPFAALLERRVRLDAALQPGAPGVDSAACAPAAIDAVVAAAPAPRAAPGFAGRQRFKLLADCARVGPERARSQAAAAALLLAYDEKLPLVGIPDFRRVDAVRARVLAAATVPRPEVHFAFDAQTPPAGALRFSAPADTRPAYVALPDELVLAARAVRAFGPGLEVVPLRIMDGVVELGPLPRGVAPEDVASRIRGLPGVREVRLGSRSVAAAPR